METENIGRKIKSRRAELGLTQKDLAGRMHISSQLVSKWETGESLPSIEYLSQLCDVLEISLTEMVGEKKRKKKVELDRETENKIVFSLTGFFALVFLICFSLIVGYSFVPAVNYNNYVANVERSIERSIARGYYNAKVEGYVDGARRESQTFQGYADANGNFCYVDANSGYVVKDRIASNSNYKWDYERPEGVNTLQDLFANQLQNSVGDEKILTLDCLKYIRKTSGGYYLEFSPKFFTSTLSNSQKKNYHLTEKIKGSIKIQNKLFRSMQVTVKYYDKPNNEHFTIKSVVTFVDQKPTIEHGDLTKKSWKLQKPAPSLDEFIAEASGETDSKNGVSQDLAWDLLNNQVYSTSSGEFCVMTADENSQQFSFFHPQTLTQTRSVDLTPSREEAGSMYYENGYVYSKTPNSITFYNANGTIKQTINFEGAGKSNYYVFEGDIYYTYTSSTNREYKFFEKYNIEKDEVVHTKSYRLLSYEDLYLKYNGKYAFWNTTDYNYYDRYYIFDLTSWEEIDCKKDKYIQYVDLQGNIYYRTSGMKTNIWCFNNDTTTITCTSYIYNVHAEHNGILIISCADSVKYQLQNGVITNVFTPLDDEEQRKLCFGDYYCVLGENEIYNINNNEVTYLDVVYFANQYIGASTFLENIGENLLTIYETNYSGTYLSYYQTTDLSRPQAWIKIEEAQVFHFGTNTFVVIDFFDEFHIYKI